MFVGKEIHDLILVIDKNREIIGNSQYAFDLDSEARQRIATFSNGIPRIRQEAFSRMEQLFWKELLWIEWTDEITDLVRYYTWSVIYQITWQGKDVHTKIQEAQDAFAKKLEAYKERIDQNLWDRIENRTNAAFEEAKAWLQCHGHGWEPA
jgi:hypothetical protein